MSANYKTSLGNTLSNTYVRWQHFLCLLHLRPPEQAVHADTRWVGKYYRMLDPDENTFVNFSCIKKVLL